MHWVFAYGSNMHLPDLDRWLREHGYNGLRPERIEPARIADFELAWNYRSVARGGGAANAMPKTGAALHGLAALVDEELLAALDLKEGHPTRYSRGDAPVPAQLVARDEVVRAWLYRVTDEHRQPSPVPPRASYLRLLIEAAETHGLDAALLEHLRRVPTDPQP